MAKKKIQLRCYRCFITLKRLIDDEITDHLVKIVDIDGNEKYICIVCLMGC